MSSPREFLASLEQIGIKLGLDQIRGLVHALDRPERAYRSIIVAGTNGKGSVTAMLERGLRTAGYRTGRYTSPHLVHLEERFAINGVSVSHQQVDDALERVREAARTLPAPPSFFEATTAVALDLFQQTAVDVAVLEVGLGGRLDATNVVDSVAAAITAIDFDHQQFLGDTIELIAGEKAGVIKSGMIVALGANPRAVNAVVEAQCHDVGASLVRTDEGIDIAMEMIDGRARLSLRTPHAQHDPMTLALRGRHQIHNAVTAVRLLEELHARALFHVPADAIRSAVEDVIWPARLDLTEVGGVSVLIDGAHNAGGARALAAYLQETYGRPLPLVLGVMGDKDVAAIVTPLAAIASHVVCTAPGTTRALPPDALAAVVSTHASDVAVTTCASPSDAVALAAAHGSPVVVAGSLYLAGEIRAEVS